VKMVGLMIVSHPCSWNLLYGVHRHAEWMVIYHFFVIMGVSMCYDACLFSLVYFSVILTSHHVMSHMTHDVMEVLGYRHPASTPSQTVPYAPAFWLHHSPLLHIPITADDFRNTADDSL
jgi:hypothetical protein